MHRPRTLVRFIIFVPMYNFIGWLLKQSFKAFHLNRQTHIHFNQLKVNLEGYLISDESIKSVKSSDFRGCPRVKPQTSVVWYWTDRKKLTVCAGNNRLLSPSDALRVDYSVSAIWEDVWGWKECYQQTPLSHTQAIHTGSIVKLCTGVTTMTGTAKGNITTPLPLLLPKYSQIMCEFVLKNMQMQGCKNVLMAQNVSSWACDQKCTF